LNQVISEFPSELAKAKGAANKNRKLLADGLKTRGQTLFL